jgi:Protein of unknown function (DUF3572)
MTAESRLNRSIEDDAETLAIKGLSFLAGHPEELGRFIALSGIEPAALRQCAADPAFLLGILDFLLADEALLMVFAEENGLSPSAIGAARFRFDGGPRD